MLDVKKALRNAREICNNRMCKTCPLSKDDIEVDGTLVYKCRLHIYDVEHITNAQIDDLVSALMYCNGVDL